MKHTRIITNKIKCNHCGDIIESVHVHDYKECSCGIVAVDGGKEYLKRSFKNSPKDFEELSECVEEELPDLIREEKGSNVNDEEQIEELKELQRLLNRLKKKKGKAEEGET